jgi:putative sterol carrier protein
MAHKFPSAEWTAAFEQVVNSSDAYANAAKGWEGDIVFIVDDSKDGIYLDLWHGKCRKSEYLSASAGVPAEFKISAPLAKWQAVLNGKLDPIQGMVTRQLKLEGNLVKIMKNVKSAQELVKCATQVPTSF